MESRQLTDFFPVNKKINAIIPSTAIKSPTDFYTLCLRDKVEGCNNSLCSNEKNSLNLKLAEQEKKLEEIDRAIEICLSICRKKGQKIEEMIATKKVNEPAVSLTKSINVNNMFSNFTNVFTHDELARLRSKGPTKKDDSSFVLDAIRYLYQNNAEKISSLSVTGNARGTEPKEKMSTEKHDTIKRLFLERLSSLHLNSTEVNSRAKQLNTHLKNAFINTKRHGIRTDDDELIRKINEKLKRTETEAKSKCILDSLKQQ